jgi:hypothetical protein
MQNYSNEKYNEMHAKVCNQVCCCVQELSLIKGLGISCVTTSAVSGARDSHSGSVTCTI